MVALWFLVLGSWFGGDGLVGGENLMERVDCWVIGLIGRLVEA